MPPQIERVSAPEENRTRFKIWIVILISFLLSIFFTFEFDQIFSVFCRNVGGWNRVGCASLLSMMLYYFVPLIFGVVGFVTCKTKQRRLRDAIIFLVISYFLMELGMFLIKVSEGLGLRLGMGY